MSNLNHIKIINLKSIIIALKCIEKYGSKNRKEPITKSNKMVS